MTGQPHERNLDHWRQLVDRGDLALSRSGTAGSRFSSTKTRAGRRTVALPAIAVQELADHMARFTPPGRDALVFGTVNGRPLDAGSRSVMFRRARRTILR